MIFIGLFCFIVFLFCVFSLSKDDFIFLRRDISIEQVFNTVFLGLPIALISSRIFYILLHPSLRYLNPLVFFAVPYFPGLSLIGGIVGSWIFVKFYANSKKIIAGRLLDIFSISFMLSFSVGILLQGILFIFTNRLLGLEEIGRSMIGFAFFFFLLLRFFKGNWQEGVLTYLMIIFYSLLSFTSVGFMILTHKGFSISSLTLTGVLFLFALVLFLYKENPLTKLVRK